MAAELERLAEQFRKHGHTEEANVLEAQAAAFRKNGVPEHFPSDKQGQSASENAGNSNYYQNLSGLQKRLFEVCANLPFESGRIETKPKVLSLERAEVINNQVGQLFEDDVQLEDLKLKSVVYPKGVPIREANAGKLQINKGFVTAHNTLLSQLITFGYGTVGSIRNAKVNDLLNARLQIAKRIGFDALPQNGISAESAKFIQIALSRPQPPSKS